MPAICSNKRKFPNFVLFQSSYKAEERVHEKTRSEMFGRVRASPFPVEFLELERLPSKLLKDDSLSVYEATILKLQQGCRKSLSSPEEMIVTVIEDNNQSSAVSESMISDLSSVSEGTITESSSETFSSTQQEGITYISDSDSSISTKESRNMSIQYLFSKYKQSSYYLKEKGLQNDELMETDEGSLTDADVSS